MKTEQLIDCEGITLESTKPFDFTCCDCGLKHRMVIVSEDGKPVGFAVKRVATPSGVQPSVVGGEDRSFLHWTVDVGYVEIWLSKKDAQGCVLLIAGPWRCPAEISAAILASKADSSGRVG